MTFNTIVLVSFESEFATGGGLGAVMKHLPKALANHKKKVILITPFFQNFPICINAFKTGTIQDRYLSCKVPYKDKKIKATILEYDNSSYRIYFIKATDFFIAPDNPYVTPGKDDQLLEDSQFLSKSVPEIMKIIPEKGPYIFHLQDWETSFVTQYLPAKFKKNCVITLHNPYDYPISNETTALLDSLPKVRKISTVSKNFASELKRDLIFTKIFTPHLQNIFRKKSIIGIENGSFLDRKIPVRITNPKDMLTYKSKIRKKFKLLLDDEISLIENFWGRCDLSNDQIPLFLIFGRDDPRQKGMDIIVQSADELLSKDKNFGYFIFAILPGLRGLDSLNDYKALATKYSGSVAVLPFRIPQGYELMQQSASYFIMSSLYEPFGGATEGYANGVPVIGRSTGGLVQQIYPYNLTDLGEHYRDIVQLFHQKSKNPTGFLFREKESENLEQDWFELIRGKYLKKSHPVSIIKERLKIELYTNMVKSAKNTLIDAQELFLNEPNEYCELIFNGFDMLTRFSWEKAAKEYFSSLYS